MSDEILAEVVELLYGPGSELVSKMEPTQSDLATKDRRKRKITAGLSAVGAGAGALGLAVGAKEIKTHGWKKTPKLTRALIPVEMAGLGGEIAATHILHGDTKKKTALKPIQKDLGDLLNNSSDIPSKGSVTRAMLKPSNRKKAVEYTRKTHGQLKKIPDKVLTTHEVEKSEGASSAEIDVVWEGDFAKADEDKQQIFGWASVVEVNGEPVVDLQGDYISAAEMEKAGYEYVMKSRKGGDMHLRDDWSPIQKSEMIESFIVTEEKRDAMGLPDSVPTGWWVGFQVQDPEVWAKVKSGKRTGFSIHGHGKRTPADG